MFPDANSRTAAESRYHIPCHKLLTQKVIATEFHWHERVFGTRSARFATLLSIYNRGNYRKLPHYNISLEAYFFKSGTFTLGAICIIFV